MRKQSNTTIAVINAVQKGKSIDEIAKELKIPKQRIYNIKWKMNKQTERVRKYVRKTPKHPEKLQTVGPYIRGAKKLRKSKANPFTEIPQSTKFVPPRSLDLAETLKHNADLYNEIKDQQAIIRYLEGLVVRLTKSTSN